MLQLKNSTKFKKDLKKFQHQQHIIGELNTVVTALLKKQTLNPKYIDHSLSDDGVDYYRMPCKTRRFTGLLDR
ncbi:type II toxin-antitoxin system YafQ family toxin [Candidatus Protochlamydia amoebophila]|uniref:Uncharacterized protein n=1 Tax=Protochlamydia amoebophila (strain UWE25) TaxID=264201 RepID=A0A2P9H990_PARUW|nr:unnamed protein product [Candidatus Protochlamydia amoebophila UWE25]